MSYEVAVEAFDAAGNVSTRTTIQAKTAACPDTQAPAAPSDFHVVATTAGSLALAWNAAEDNVGVTGYNVYLTGVRVAAVTGTTHTLTGLACNVAYSLAIEAVDAAGNISGRATLLASTAACPDTQSPTPPKDLYVTASSGTSLTVAWKPSTDNVGVTGYDVHVAGDGGVSTSATSATLTGLSCGASYDVTVAAIDAATNKSSPATLADTTDLCPAPPPSGGTLRVDLTSDFDFTDPAIDYFSHGWQMQYETELRLYNYPDKAAPEGSVLWHEAAAGMPLISDDGKTYTIMVEPGFKFSDGTPVTAANFAYAINRDLRPQMVSPAIDFIRDIVGADDVINGKTTTASGVQVKGDKLIIQLVKPAGDFAARLALPFFSAVKTDMPIDPNGVAIFPSAGPYHVTSWVRNTSATLERNPFYAGPRPANADTIQYTIGTTLAAQELRVINGDTDLGGFPTADTANLANTYGVNQPDGQFHVATQNTFWYVNLNTSRPPFNNVNLRKAVNYAVDRPALAAAMGAYASTPTDQILPPGIRGFRDADIYPLGAPDLDKARELAGSSCGAVKLWTFNTSFGPAWGIILQQNLMQIGCAVTVTALDRVVETTMGGTRGADFDLLVNGWGQDYPDPYDFVDPLLNGTRLQPSNNVNLSYFDDPIVNAKLGDASALTGPSRYETYGDLDVEIMRDYAPMAPIVNTNARIFNSSHVGGFVYQPVYGTDLGTFVIK